MTDKNSLDKIDLRIRSKEKMKTSSIEMIDEFFSRHQDLEFNRNDVIGATEDIVSNRGKKILACGNGGSASDSEHIIGELMKGFKLRRELTADDRKKFTDMYGEEEGNRMADNLQYGIPSVSLVCSCAILSAFVNDVDPDLVFAQQVFGLGNEGDYLIGLTTSGNSKNVVLAAKVAKLKGLKVIGFTQDSDNKLNSIADWSLNSPKHETYLIQEDHIKLYHLLCALVENEYYAD